MTCRKDLCPCKLNRVPLRRHYDNGTGRKPLRRYSHCRGSLPHCDDLTTSSGPKRRHRLCPKRALHRPAGISRRKRHIQQRERPLPQCSNLTLIHHARRLARPRLTRQHILTAL